MFTGIVELLGKVVSIKKEGTNVHFTLQSDFTKDLKIDQSVAHNGVCLTVVSIQDNTYTVTAIQETLQKTTLAEFSVGTVVNLERGMKLGARLDGHLVQGHVDQTGVCTAIQPKGGSWIFTFNYDPALGNVTIEKGSVTINGTSLTVVNSTKTGFSVAIIPYTFEHTVFQYLQVGQAVNLEFDVIGKYVARLYGNRQ